MLWGYLLDGAALDAAEQRKRGMQRAWLAYEGYYPAPLPVVRGQANDNVTQNKVRAIADKAVSFLFGKPLAFQIDEGQETPRELWLKEVWRANRQDATLLKLGMNGALTGQPFIKLIPADGVRYRVPRLIVLDPSSVDVDYDPDDLEYVTRYCICWEAMDPAQRRVMKFRQSHERRGRGWVILDEQSVPGSDTWTQIRTMAWPYEWSQIHTCQNLPRPNEFWGGADIEDDVLGLIFSRNYLLSNMQRVIRYYGHPKEFVTGADLSGITWQAGQVLELPEGATANTLDSRADLVAALSYDRRLDEAIHEVARVPPISTGKIENVGPLSGVAMQILYQPLIELTQAKRALYGPMLDDICQHIMELGGHEPASVTIIWPEVLPTDQLEERETALADLDLGVSRATLHRKLGYDPEFEEHQRAEEEDDIAERLARSGMTQPARSDSTGQRRTERLNREPLRD